MIKRIAAFSVMVLLISLMLPMPMVHAAGYELPEAWQAMRVHHDGSITVYDYRVYMFPSGSPPTDKFPYSMSKIYSAQKRFLQYSNMRVYLLDTTLTKDQMIDIIRGKADIPGKPLQVHKATETDYEVSYYVHVPDQGQLILFVVYDVSPKITIIDKKLGWAYTFYRFVNMGKTEAIVEDYYMAVAFDEPMNCQGHKSIEKNKQYKDVCPCIMVQRFTTGTIKANLQKGCDYSLFTVHGQSTIKENSLRVAYPIDYIVPEQRDKLDKSVYDPDFPEKLAHKDNLGGGGSNSDSQNHLSWWQWLLFIMLAPFAFLFGGKGGSGSGWSSGSGSFGGSGGGGSGSSGW